MYNFQSVSEVYEESRKYRNLGQKAPFPPYVTFELSNCCNFKCIMCFRTYIHKERENIGLDLFEEALNEISTWGSMIRFIGYEEPFLYPHIEKAIEIVKNKNLLLHITTNGSLVDERMVDLLIDSEVDSIIFSFQGLSESEYIVMRNSNHVSYENVKSNIARLYKKRNSNKPFIKVTTTITERDKSLNYEHFAKDILAYVDEVQITGYTHFTHIEKLIGYSSIYEELKIVRPRLLNDISCNVPNFEMIIRANGNVLPCCGAITEDLLIGNITKNSLFQIWNTEKLERIREALANKHLNLYRDCYACPRRYSFPDHGNSLSNVMEGALLLYKK